MDEKKKSITFRLNLSDPRDEEVYGILCNAVKNGMTVSRCIRNSVWQYGKEAKMEKEQDDVRAMLQGFQTELLHRLEKHDEKMMSLLLDEGQASKMAIRGDLEKDISKEILPKESGDLPDGVLDDLLLKMR